MTRRVRIHRHCHIVRRIGRAFGQTKIAVWQSGNRDLQVQCCQRSIAASTEAISMGLILKAPEAVGEFIVAGESKVAVRKYYPALIRKS